MLPHLTGRSTGIDGVIFDAGNLQKFTGVFYPLFGN